MSQFAENLEEVCATAAVHEGTGGRPRCAS
jgi:hypothetical protein